MNGKEDKKRAEADKEKMRALQKKLKQEADDDRKRQQEIMLLRIMENNIKRDAAKQ